jgi:hypothetical protein
MRCENGKAVDSAFEKHHVTDYNKRIGYLTRCLGNPEIRYGGREANNPKDEVISRYLTVRSVFITGSWR